MYLETDGTVIFTELDGFRGRGRAHPQMRQLSRSREDRSNSFSMGEDLRSHWWQPKEGVVRRLRRAISRRVCLETNHDMSRTIIIAGSARGGTTWLARILEDLLHYRLIFEPFLPGLVEEYAFELKKYLRPGDADPAFRSFVERVLKGDIRNAWVDQSNRSLIARGRIVKEVRGNFCLKWIRENFPSVPIVYILRHPCAVVHSRERMGRLPAVEVQSILSQELMLKDHLEPYLNAFENAHTSLAQFAFVWCAEQLVALRTMNMADWVVTTYEDLLQNADGEIQKIMKYVFPDGYAETKTKIKAPTSIISESTRTDSAILTNRNPLDSWKTDLNQRQIEEIMEMLRRFRLDTIYDESSLPHHDSIRRILKHECSL